MNIVKSVFIAFAMFSRIPMPRVAWNKASMRYTMAAFPLVGVVVGAVLFGWNWLCEALSFGPLARGAGFALLPLLLTGGIHMDGFCDTVDALASQASPQRKQEILKDPHAGAFAAMAAAAYLLGFAALASELPQTPLAMAAFAGLFVLSRALSGLAVVFFRCARESGLAHTFADAAARRGSAAVLALFALSAAAVMVLCGGLPGVVALAVALAMWGLYHRTAVRQFGGISGDLAGWFLQLCELLSLGGLVFAQKLPALF